MALLGAVLATPAHAQQDSSPNFGAETIDEQIFTRYQDVGTLDAFPAATGGDGTLTYSLTGPNATANDVDLPEGLSFDAATRVLSGTPTAPLAKTAYTYRVVDSDTTDPDEDTITFKIGVRPFWRGPDGEPWLDYSVSYDNGQLTLTWEPIAGVTGWSYYLNHPVAGSSEWTDIVGSSASTTTHTITGVTNGYRYVVGLTAFVGTGDARVDGLRYDGIFLPLAEGAPSGATAAFANPGDGQLALNWSYTSSFRGYEPSSVDSEDVSSITGWRYRIGTSELQTEPNGATREVTTWLEWQDISGSSSATRSHTVTGLVNGTAYRFVVQPENASGIGIHSDPDLFAGGGIYRLVRSGTPAIPEGASLSAGDGEVTLSWDDPGDSSITGWQYRSTPYNSRPMRLSYRFTNPINYGFFDPWVSIPGSVASTTSHTVTGLTNGTEYAFEIRAVNAHGAGPSAADAAPFYEEFPEFGFDYFATPLRSGVPGAPTGFEAESGAGGGEVSLSWDDPGDTSITSWQYQGTRSGGYPDSDWTEIAGSGPSTTGHTVSGLARYAPWWHSPYWFRVRAVNATGAGAPSGWNGDGLLPGIAPGSGVVAPTVVPKVPSGLMAAAGDGEVVLSWDGLGDGSVDSWRYRIGRVGGGVWVWGSAQDIAGSSASTTGHTVSGLVNGESYRFGVWAVNEVGAGSEARGSEVIPLAAGALSAPEGVAAAAGDQRVTLSWDGVSGATGYQYQLVGATRGAWVGVSDAAAASVAVTGLSNGAEYSLRVRAVKDAVLGAASGFVATTPSMPPVVAVEIPDQSVSVGGWRIVDLANTFSDADGDELTFSFAGDLVIDGDNVDPAYVAPANGVATLSTSPAGGPASQLLVAGVKEGSTEVTVTATDPGGASVTDVFTVTVTAAVVGNAAPAVAAPMPDLFDGGDLTSGLLVGSSRTFDLGAVFGDADSGDVLTFTAVSSVPGAAAVSVKGSVLTVSALAPGYALVLVYAYDGNGGVVGDGLVVSSVAAPRPVSIEVADLSVSVDGWRIVDLANAFGGFVDDQVFAAAAAADGVVELTLPSSRVECGCVLDSLLRVEGVAEGSTMVTVSTVGPDVAPSKDAFMVTVTAAVQDNNAPTVAAALSDTALYTGGAATLDLADVFADEDDGDVLSYIAESAAPAVAGVSVTGSELTISAGASPGESEVTVRVYDGNGGSVSDEFMVTVTRRPPPPVAAPVGPELSAPGEPVYTGRVCPPAVVPDGGFGDLAGWPAEIATAVDCVAWDGVTRGATPTTFAPAEPLSRRQVALFLTRLIAKRQTLPAAENPAAGSWDGESAEAAAQLGQLGVVDAGAYTTEQPDTPMARAELAVYAARVLALLGVTLPSDPPSRFDDIGAQTPQAALAINQLAALGVMIGTTESTFEPAEPLTRSQMALVLTRMFARIGIFPGQATN